MGVERADTTNLSRLLALKLVTNPTVAYAHLGKIIQNSNTFENYVLEYGSNGTFVEANNLDVYLIATNVTLVGGILTVKWNFFLHLHEIVEGLYFHCSLSVCLCVCPAILVNKILAERMQRLRRGFR